MILTITPNPSVDLLYEAEQLVWDDANRVEMPRRRAGGQGVNLTRAARVLGADSVALVVIGGRSGDELRGLLDDDPTPYVVVPIAHDTRVFVAVRETSTGRSMLVNPRGPILEASDRARLLDQVERTCNELKPGWIVCSGSVPRGLGDDLYARIANVARKHNARFIADCDAAPLEPVLQEGCDLIAPNKHEAERLVSCSITSLADAAEAARTLRRSAPRVLIKLGEQGAVLADESGCWHARGEAQRTGSAVGAGDAFLAGFLTAEKNGAPPEEALRSAVAAGGAVLSSSGSELIARATYESVRANVRVAPF